MTMNNEEWERLKGEEMKGKVDYLYNELHDLKNKVNMLVEELRYHERLGGHGI
mgnify:CR=1 FL=1